MTTNPLRYVLRVGYACGDVRYMDRAGILHTDGSRAACYGYRTVREARIHARSLAGAYSVAVVQPFPN